MGEPGSVNWLAFLSALGGGVITAASSLWLAVRRERREAERDAQDRARELKMGARLVHEQLLLASAIAKTSRATKCWWVDPWIEKFRGAWTSSASLLARDCESLVWLRVSYAVSIVEELVGYRAMSEGRLVTDQDAELIPGMCEDIDAGIAALKPYI